LHAIQQSEQVLSEAGQVLDNIKGALSIRTLTAHGINHILVKMRKRLSTSVVATTTQEVADVEPSVESMHDRGMNVVAQINATLAKIEAYKDCVLSLNATSPPLSEREALVQAMNKASLAGEASLMTCRKELFRRRLAEHVHEKKWELVVRMFDNRAEAPAATADWSDMNLTRVSGNLEERVALQTQFAVKLFHDSLLGSVAADSFVALADALHRVTWADAHFQTEVSHLVAMVGSAPGTSKQTLEAALAFFSEADRENSKLSKAMNTFPFALEVKAKCARRIAQLKLDEKSNKDLSDLVPLVKALTNKLESESFSAEEDAEAAGRTRQNLVKQTTSIFSSHYTAYAKLVAVSSTTWLTGLAASQLQDIESVFADVWEKAATYQADAFWAHFESLAESFKSLDIGSTGTALVDKIGELDGAITTCFTDVVALGTDKVPDTITSVLNSPHGISSDSGFGM
jgi:hypothetical protein